MFLSKLNSLLSSIVAVILIQNILAAPSKFSITIYTDGRYELKVSNKTWLRNSPSHFLKANGQTYTTQDKTLYLNGSYGRSGSDQLGRWQSVMFNFTAFDDLKTQLQASVITYDDYDMVRFQQYFPNGAKRTGSSNYNSVLSAFPSFMVQTYDETDIGFLSYGGMMAGDMEKLYGRWNELTTSINDGLQGGPIILFNPNGDTLVISQMSQFLSTSMQHNRFSGGHLNYGIMSGVNEVPVNFSADFLVYYSDKGINTAMEEWGKVLLKFYNKDLSVKENDFTANYLAYWTDNGAYYYWMTEPNKNYENTLLDYFNDAKSREIPFRTVQYDSWWYGAQRGYRQGAFQWDGTRKTDKLPNSLTYVYEKLGLPVTAHNKFWDAKVEYARQNGGAYNFVIDELTGKSLPDDQQFWDDLLYNASSKWGLVTYEQDWLNHQTLDFTPLLTDIALGRRWLAQMAAAAAKNKLTVQYCMSLPRHVLQSVEFDFVTQIRVTNDYATNFQYGGEQWRLGVSSLFSAALGLAPFKDVYWTTGDQPGNPYGPKAIDSCVELNSVISTLTAGPVGPGDAIGNYTNKALIMRSCNENGLLLKPSRPITAIDAQIYAKALGSAYGPIGEVWSTYSKIDDYVFGILLAADLKSQFKVTPGNVGFNVSNNMVVRKDDSLDIAEFSSRLPLTLDQNCTKTQFCLYHFSPKFTINGHDVAIVGEKAKWVPVSPQRTKSISIGSSSLAVSLGGVKGEQIEYFFNINSVINKVVCTPTSTNAKITIDLSSSTPSLSCE